MMRSILWRKAVETDSVELIGYINSEHHLLVNGEVPLDPGEVKIIVFPREKIEEEDDISTDVLLKVARNGGAFEFLNDPEEDIYSMDDGIPINE